MGLGRYVETTVNYLSLFQNAGNSVTIKKNILCCIYQNVNITYSERNLLSF